MLVEIRKLLEHLISRLLLLVPDLAPQFDHFRLGVLAVYEGTLQREIDKAGDCPAIENGDLPHQQRLVARLLQHREEVTNVTASLVNFVDEEEMRDAGIAQSFQIG